MLNSIQKRSFKFSGSLLCDQKVFGLILSLSKMLHMKKLDILLANALFESVQSAIHNDSKNREDFYKQMYGNQKPLSKVWDSINDSEKSQLSKSARTLSNY